MSRSKDPQRDTRSAYDRLDDAYKDALDELAWRSQVINELVGACQAALDTLTTMEDHTRAQTGRDSALAERLRNAISKRHEVH